MTTAEYTLTGDELAAWMRDHKYTYLALSKALGVSKSTLWRWRDGTHPIPQTAVMALRYLEAPSLTTTHGIAADPPLVALSGFPVPPRYSAQPDHSAWRIAQ